MPVLGDALPHRAVEILQAVFADPGFLVGRDVGRIDRAERRAHLEAARERLAARHRMARDAVAGAGHDIHRDFRRDRRSRGPQGGSCEVPSSARDRGEYRRPPQQQEAGIFSEFAA